MIVQNQVKFWILWFEENHSRIYLITSYTRAAPLLSWRRTQDGPLDARPQSVCSVDRLPGGHGLQGHDLPWGSLPLTPSPEACWARESHWRIGLVDWDVQNLTFYDLTRGWIHYFTESPGLTFIDPISHWAYYSPWWACISLCMLLPVIFLCAFCLSLPLKEDTLGGRNAVLHFFYTSSRPLRVSAAQRSLANRVTRAFEWTRAQMKAVPAKG